MLLKKLFIAAARNGQWNRARELGDFVPSTRAHSFAILKALTAEDISSVTVNSIIDNAPAKHAEPPFWRWPETATPKPLAI